MTSLSRLQDVFATQKALATQSAPVSFAERKHRLTSLEKMVLDRREIFRAAIADDFGSHDPRLVDLMETGPVIERVRHVRDNFETWLQPETIDLGIAHGSSHGEIHHLPKGVMGNIAPWNFPVESSLVMCADMLAAGNTVIIKPSEFSPATAQAVEDAVTATFAPEVLSVIQGDLEFARNFAEMPWDHLTFTGSPSIGRLVAQAAAKNLSPVTLELGGKNPAVFMPDGVVPDLIKLFLSFRVLKAGQICTSPDYVMVPREQLDEWVAIARQVWTDAYPSYIGHPDATGIINKTHYARLMGYIDEARSHGCEVISLNDETPDRSLRQIPPTLILNPADDMACLCDEIFGPVIPVLPYDTIERAMAQINAGPSPLASYLATYDSELAMRFVQTVRSGGAAINNFGLQGGHVALPFGGFGQSGHGCHSSRNGVLGYTHTKSVYYGAEDSIVHEVLAPPLSDLTGIAADGMFANHAGEA